MRNIFKIINLYCLFLVKFLFVYRCCSEFDIFEIFVINIMG